MARRRHTLVRGRPHLPVDDPDARGTCLVCHRPTGTANDMHQLPDIDPEIAQVEARRLGERQDPDA